MTTVSGDVCIVCGETATADLMAACNGCNQPFHFRQREDIEGKDCGQAWIDPEFMTIEFACNDCLHPAPPVALDAIITAGEAAERTGMTEEAIVALADAGQIPHRKAGGTVYLFEATDIDALHHNGNRSN